MTLRGRELKVQLLRLAGVRQIPDSQLDFERVTHYAMDGSGKR